MSSLVHEFFNHYDNGHEYIYRTDNVDTSKFKGAIAQCYTVYNPNNYEAILRRLEQGKSVAMCSDRCLTNLTSDKSEDIGNRILNYQTVAPMFGGSRRVTQLDILHAEIYRSYSHYRHGGELSEKLLERAILAAKAHPMFPKLKFTGLDAHNCVLYMSMLVDPRRFINPNDLQDKSYYYNYTLVKSGIPLRMLQKLKNDDTYEPTGTEARTWTSLMWCWAPQIGEVPKMLSDDNALYWIRRYWEYLKQAPVYTAAEADHFARTWVTREVGDYILELWFEALGITNFEPKTFFKSSRLAQDYISKFK